MERVIELRDFCEALPAKTFPEIYKLRLTADEWNLVNVIKSTLFHFAVQSKILQTERVSLSDFFGGWAKMKFEMGKLENDELAVKLLAEMKKREPSLLNNPLLNAAVFLDPRYQQYMPNHHKETAIKLLSKLNDKIKTLASSGCQPKPPTSEPHEFGDFLCTMYDNVNVSNDDEETTIENNDKSQCTSAKSIDSILREFIGEKDALQNMTIFEYWENNRIIKPELYNLAMIIHSIPPTQTTVERAFSAMALILSPLRTNLSDKHLEEILLLRLNKDLFD